MLVGDKFYGNLNSKLIVRVKLNTIEKKELKYMGCIV